MGKFKTNNLSRQEEAVYDDDDEKDDDEKDENDDDEARNGGRQRNVDRVVAAISGSPDVVPIDEDNNRVANDAAKNDVAEEESYQENC